MPKEPGTVTRRMHAVGLVLLLALLLLLPASAPSRADLPTVVNDPLKSTRTATWAMTAAQGLNLSGAVLAGAHAELPWTSRNVSWTRPETLEEAAAPLDANLTPVPGGIGLRYDPNNYIANPEFVNGSAWGYGSGAAGMLNASWQASSQTGQFRYVSPSTQVLWDPMDSIATWGAVAYGTANASRWLNTSSPRQGTGAIELDCNFSAGSVSTAGLVNSSSSVNWSAGDRLVLWVYLNASAPLTFNISALDRSFVTRFSAPQPITAGWHEMSVDLNELGTEATRQQLADVRLQVNGEGVGNRAVVFDDVRVGFAKAFTDVGYISQSFDKGNVTTSSTGSAVLGLRWYVANVSGLLNNSTVSLSGPGGTVTASLNAAPLQTPFTFDADVSTTTTAAGRYTLNVTLSIEVNTTAPCNVTTFLDGVSLRFPNRQPGVYLSHAFDLVNDSEFQSVTWSALTDNSTSASLDFRAGQGVPAAIAWDNWASVPSSGPVGPTAGRFFQVRVQLGTTNASDSPVLTSVVVTTSHRVASGVVTSEPFTAGMSSLPDQFLKWRNLTAKANVSASTQVRFSVGDGHSWYDVVPGDDFTPLYAARTIVWRAVLTTQDTLFTPSLSLVNLTWEYLGPVARVAITPGTPQNVTSGRTIQFAASGFDSGNHSITVLALYWLTNDPTGNVSQNGLYRAGTPGTWNVTVTVVGTPSIWSQVPVNVTRADVTPLANPYVPWLLGVLAAGAIGFAVYEVEIRRLFAIEDVFVIGRDGRLLMHNTRRMRADRDEDVLSGMLTAMISFLRDWDPEENGKARRFDYGDKIALLEHGVHVFVAAVYAGRVPRWASRDLERFVRDLEVRFGTTFARWTGDPADLHGLREFVDRFSSRTRYRGDKRSGPGAP